MQIQDWTNLKLQNFDFQTSISNSNLNSYFNFKHQIQLQNSMPNFNFKSHKIAAKNILIIHMAKTKNPKIATWLQTDGRSDIVTPWAAHRS